MFKTEWSTDLDEEWSFPTFLYNSMLNSTRVLTKDKRDLTISSQSKARFEIWNWLVKLCFFFSFLHTKFDNNIICLRAQFFVKQTKTHHARSRFYPTFKLLRVYHLLVQLSLFNFIHSWFSLQNKCKRHGQFSVTRKQNNFFQLCYEGSSAREFAV